MALGASRMEIFRMFFQQGMFYTSVGVVLGLGAALVSTRLMASLLFGIGANDPLTFVTISFLIVAVSVVAMYLPARRATRLDSMTLLRYE